MEGDEGHSTRWRLGEEGGGEGEGVVVSSLPGRRLDEKIFLFLDFPSKADVCESEHGHRKRRSNEKLLQKRRRGRGQRERRKVVWNESTGVHVLRVGGCWTCLSSLA